MSTASRIQSTRFLTATVTRIARAEHRRLVWLLALAIALLAARPAVSHGQTSATSSAFGESVSVQFSPLPLIQGASATSGPLPTVSGTAAPPYNQTQTTASVSVSAGGPIGQVLQTGLLTAHATSDVPNSDSVAADATVNNLSLGVLSLLSVGATTVKSTATIGGTCGTGLTRSGVTTIENGTATSSLLGGLVVNATPAPNTDILNLLGVRIRLNEQITTGDLVSTAGITVNAIHVTVNNFLLNLLGTLNVDIVIAQSKASITCGPAPTATRTGTATATRTNTPIPPTATRTPTLTGTATATRTETPCSPAPSSVTSSAFGESIDLTLLGGLITVSSGPTPTAAGVAGAPYDQTNQIASVTLSAGIPIGQILDTGLIIAHAESDGPASGASAAATVNDLDLDITALLGLAATTIQSTASLSGCTGNFDLVGTTTIEGAALTGALAGLTINAHPGPNTVLLDVLGLRVVLNEQITTPTSLTVNAIHITLNNFLLGGAGLVSGDIVIAQSVVGIPGGAFPTASVTPTRTATPVPPTATGTSTRTPIPPTATRTSPPASTATATATRTQTPCSPAPSSVTSSAFGESIDLTLLGGLITVSSGPTPTAAGVAGAPYDQTNQIASVTLSAGIPIGQILDTGLIIAHAESDGPASGASAAATVNDLDLDITALLGLAATTIQSTASLSGCTGNFDLVGTTTIEGAAVNGALAGLTINAHPGPNTVLLDILGLRVVLNEQITTPTSLTVNAIHITLNNFLLGGAGLVSGDIVIAQSVVGIPGGAFPTASVTPTRTATPVPPTATRTATNTAIVAPPTATRTATNTAVPPTQTRTSTPLPPTATRTATRTATQVPCAPTPPGVSSSAFGESVSLSLQVPIVGGVSITSGPMPASSGSTTGSPYNDPDSAASVSVGTLATGQILGTGLLTTLASSSGPGGGAHGEATVNGLDLDVVGLLNLAGLSATTVRSTADVSGCCGNVTRSGNTIIENAVLTGALANATIDAEIEPNTVLFNLGGLRIVLNEQISTATGITVNAIHITLTAFVVSPTIGTLSGDIIIAQSTASTQCAGAPTATATRTNTPVPPTATRTATNTPIVVPPTATRTNTPIPATATRTSTPIPATATRTSTPLPPTATRTATRTATQVPCAPTPPGVSSSAFGESVSLSLQVPIVGGVSITSGPMPASSGSTTGSPYNDPDSAASVSVGTLATGQILGTGLLTTLASSSGPGGGAHGEATVNGLDLDVVGLLNLAGLSATTVRSTADVSGCCGNVTRSGNTIIENAVLTGALANATIDAEIEPNTVLFNLGGLRIVLNEQISTATGITVNAIHITLTAFVVSPTIGTLSGDIIIAQSTASTQCAGAPTATATRTNTPVPPTATRTATNTAVPPTATRTATNTPIVVPPTATRTNTPIPATATRTNTPVPATATRTNTPIPATATRTNTPVPATATRTNTAVPPTATRTATNSPVPPTATRTATFAPGTATQTATQTPVPPTATRTNTPVPATATRTNTPVPPTATRTNTPIPPTATRTATNSPVPPTATRTATFAPGTATQTATQTPVPPTATRTNTPVPATATRTNTPVPPTATRTNTPIPATATRTNTPVPATATRTNTPIPATATRTATFAPGTATQTATHTAVPPTATRTNTPLPPTATRTATSTAVPPTSTRTNTPVPATATRTATPVPPTAASTATNTAVPPTATRTATAVPPTATGTATETPIPPTSTRTATVTPVPATATQTFTPVPPTSTGTATATPTVTLTPTPSATSTPTPCDTPLVSSSAFGEMIDLDVGPLDGAPFKLTSDRSPLVSGSAPPYSLGDALPVVDMEHILTGEILHTQILSVSALGDASDIARAQAESRVDSMQLHITELSSLLSLRANRISSTALIEGTCCTGFTATGHSTFDQGSLDCLIGVGLPLDPSPAPNSVILDGVGMRIVLNEQIVEGDGQEKLSMTVNAVHIHLDEVLITGLGSISGDIYFGQSKASLSCGGEVVGNTCLGDCDRNGVVAVHELVLSVSIALGNLPMSSCQAIDENPHDGRAAINELVEAVYHALYGCPEVRNER